MSDRYAAITAHAAQFDIRMMCAALDVSPSGYYAAVARTTAAPTARVRARARRRVVVRAMFLRCRKRYGAPRLVRELRDAGHRIAKKSVARILQEEGLAARRATPFVCTTDSAHDDPIAPNVLARQFAVGTFATTNLAWVGDMTYIPTRAGWLDLAVLLDLASRRVVGWAVGTTLESRLPHRAAACPRGAPTGGGADSAHGPREPRRIQSVVATPGCPTDFGCSFRASAGVFHPNVVRGLLLKASATA